MLADRRPSRRHALLVRRFGRARTRQVAQNHGPNRRRRWDPTPIPGTHRFWKRFSERVHCLENRFHQQRATGIEDCDRDRRLMTSRPDTSHIRESARFVTSPHRIPICRSQYRRMRIITTPI